MPGARSATSRSVSWILDECTQQIQGNDELYLDDALWINGQQGGRELRIEGYLGKDMNRDVRSRSH